MVKSEPSMRPSFYNRLQLLLWEAVIKSVDIVRNFREGWSQPQHPKIKMADLTGPQSVLLVLFLILGAASGLIAGAALAFLSLYR